MPLAVGIYYLVLLVLVVLLVVWCQYCTKLKNTSHKASFKPGLPPILNLESQGPTRTLVCGGCVVTELENKEIKDCGGCVSDILALARKPQTLGKDKECLSYNRLENPPASVER